MTKSTRSFGNLSRIVVLAVISLIVGAGFAGLASNLTASAPLGFYIRSAGGVYARVCPPEPWLSLSSARGYRQAGASYRCADGGMPLLKPVVAGHGDLVQVSADGIRVNGMLLRNSAPLEMDSHGRPLVHWPYGDYRVAAGEVWLVSSYEPRSFDSRYFGPVPESAIKERLRALATF